MDAEKSAQATGGPERQHVIRELCAVLGEEWVSDSPAVLSRYHRATVQLEGKHPEIVVFPSTGSEVKDIIAIIRKHDVPLYSMSALSNHTEFRVSKHGGVLMDLRRMDIVGG